MRIALLDSADRLQAFFDTDLPQAAKAFDMELHLYLKQSASTFSMKAYRGSKAETLLEEGKFLAFRYRGREYHMQIRTIDRGATETSVECWGLPAEIVNGQVEASPEVSESLSFAGHFALLEPCKNVLTLGLDETYGNTSATQYVAKQKWEQNETALTRLFAIGSMFDAEIEFVTALNDDYSLKLITMNVYREDVSHGIGQDRTDRVIRYSPEIKEIRRSADLSEMCTALKPIVKDGDNVRYLSYYVVKGNTEHDGNRFIKEEGSELLVCPEAAERYPAKNNGGYIIGIFEPDSEAKEDPIRVWNTSVAELRKRCVPKVSFEIDGTIRDANIGDTFLIKDESQYIRTRVTELSLHPDDISKDSMKLDNFTVVSPKLAQNSAQEVEE